ncbi:hypothetical protein BLNAU_15558 [Blattamonas nauphoetae]|uniref:Uncharacterized protein n=1 Tax=Blattamonas nauphoetae TaxID=2049346 RepID=A0ABQ9XE26_9EUKA|nr:hypothetical protein BLNAU_15558 [Blattamonas nauphoetae]
MTTKTPILHNRQPELSGSPSQILTTYVVPSVSSSERSRPIRSNSLPATPFAPSADLLPPPTILLIRKTPSPSTDHRKPASPELDRFRAILGINAQE